MPMGKIYNSPVKQISKTDRITPGCDVFILTHNQINVLTLEGIFDYVSVGSFAGFEQVIFN